MSGSATKILREPDPLRVKSDVQASGSLTFAVRPGVSGAESCVMEVDARHPRGTTAEPFGARLHDGNKLRTNVDAHLLR